VSEIRKTIERVACDLHTDDNAATADPLFCVFQKQRVYGVSSDYTDDFVWVIPDGEGTEADLEEAAHLEKIGREAAEALGWRRVGYKEFDAFVTACLTRAGAEACIARDGHNLRQPFVYVTSLYRNEEMISVRKHLMTLKPVPPPPPKYAPNTCNRHDDCAAADEKAQAKGCLFAVHCRDEDCEDCFGQ